MSSTLLLGTVLLACVESQVKSIPDTAPPDDGPTEPDDTSPPDTGLSSDTDSDTDTDTDTDADTDADTDTDTDQERTPQDTISASLDAVFADLDVTPDGQRLYATRVFHQDLIVVSTEDLSLLATIPLGGEVSQLRLFPDGLHALVAINSQPGRTLVLDTDPTSPSFHTIVGSLTLTGNGSLGVAPHPDGTRAAAITQRPDPGVIKLFSFPDLTVAATLSPAATGPAPILSDIRFNANGTLGYATIAQSGPGNDLVVFDPNAQTLTATIDLGLPHDGGGASSLAVVDVAGDTQVWVSNNSWVTAGLSVLDARTETVLTYLDQGETGGGDLCARPGAHQVLWVAPNVPIRAFDTDTLSLSHIRTERDDHSHCVVSVDDEFVFISTVSGDLLKVDLLNLIEAE